jgi:oligopeptide transport system substrate-binding protein
MHKIKTLPILLCLALLLAGCMGDTAGKIFRYDIPGPIANLDPQSATDPAARLILANMMEGLVVKTPGGGVGPGVAESNTVSDDGLRSSFKLRAGAVWRNGDPVTADDFVFAFRRLFSYPTGLANGFSAIRNAAAVQEGVADASVLGVRTDGDDTLVFTLTHPDPFFLERLSDPAALPCNQAFFLETKGRYGLERGSVLSNGPFYLDSWDNENRIQLRANESYVSARATVAAGVNLHVGREDAAQQFLGGAADLALLSALRQEELDGVSAEIAPIEKTVWCMVFNQNHPVWGNPLLRQGLACAIDRELLGESLPEGFATTPMLIPGAVRVTGHPYREMAGLESPLTYDAEEAQRLFALGLEVLGRETLPDNSTVVMPELASAALNIGRVREGWQQHLAAYPSFAVESPAQIEERFRGGDYQILIMPMTPATGDIEAIMAAFTSGSPQNYFGYKSALYDELFANAAVQPTSKLAAEKYAQAEQMILADAVVVPLFFETSYLASQNETRDVVYSPFGDILLFKYGRRAG